MRPCFLYWLIVFQIFGLAATPLNAMRKARRSIVQIKFVRSGGFAGAATRVEGTVDLKSDHPAFISQGAGYQRSLSPPEVEELRCAADPSAKCSSQAASFNPAPVPDGLQYDVTITTSDGKARKITIRPDSHSDFAGIAPELAGWIQEEAKKIWEHRLSKR